MHMARPSVITPTVVKSLTEAFHIGATVEEACRHARISKPTYYKTLRQNEGFSNEMETAQDFVILMAKKVVVDAIRKGDVRIAFRYLERKKSDEFGEHPLVSVGATEPSIDYLSEGRRRAMKYQ